MALQHILIPVLYWYFSVGRNIDDDLVIFADAHSDSLPYSMQQMHQAMSARGYHVEKHICNFNKIGFVAKLRAIIYFTKSYARAKYVFICSYYLPVSSCKKRTETTVVQLWHASGTWKKIGYDSPEDIPRFSLGSQARNYDLVTVSAPALIPYYTSAFRLEKDAAVATGISRTDTFFNPSYADECMSLWLDTYPQMANKKVALWVPTFRGRAQHPYTAGVEDIELLDLGDDWVLVCKLHTNAKEGVKLFQPDIPTEKILSVADVVVTDFSTILFEAALLEKPVILFQPQKKTYEKGRGLYFPASRIPAPLVTDGSDLKGAVLKAQVSYNQDGWKQFTKEYMSACDGRSTERIIEYITSRRVS